MYRHLISKQKKNPTYVTFTSIIAYLGGDQVLVLDALSLGCYDGLLITSILRFEGMGAETDCW